jgi:hypothetical protein
MDRTHITVPISSLSGIRPPRLGDVVRGKDGKPMGVVAAVDQEARVVVIQCMGYSDGIIQIEAEKRPSLPVLAEAKKRVVKDMVKAMSEKNSPMDLSKRTTGSREPDQATGLDAFDKPQSWSDFEEE